jgi:hypothetical protein
MSYNRLVRVRVTKAAPTRPMASPSRVICLAISPITSPRVAPSARRILYEQGVVAHETPHGNFLGIKLESGWHHADDPVRLSIEIESSADDDRLPAKLCFSERVTQTRASPILSCGPNVRPRAARTPSSEKKLGVAGTQRPSGPLVTHESGLCNDAMIVYNCR